MNYKFKNPDTVQLTRTNERTRRRWLSKGDDAKRSSRAKRFCLRDDGTWVAEIIKKFHINEDEREEEEAEEEKLITSSWCWWDGIFITANFCCFLGCVIERGESHFVSVFALNIKCSAKLIGKASPRTVGQHNQTLSSSYYIFMRLVSVCAGEKVKVFHKETKAADELRKFYSTIEWNKSVWLSPRMRLNCILVWSGAFGPPRN